MCHKIYRTLSHARLCLAVVTDRIQKIQSIWYTASGVLTGKDCLAPNEGLPSRRTGADEGVTSRHQDVRPDYTTPEEEKRKRRGEMHKNSRILDSLDLASKSDHCQDYL